MTKRYTVRRREPRSVEQCGGCSETVAIYSDRQIVAGEPLCSECRRELRREDAAEKAATGREGCEILAPTPMVCDHTETGTSPTGVRFCLNCLDRVEL